MAGWKTKKYVALALIWWNTLVDFIPFSQFPTQSTNAIQVWSRKQ